jgi:mannosyl-oligosaccharide glucosidase
MQSLDYSKMRKEAISAALGSIGYFFGPLSRKINNWGHYVDIVDSEPKALFTSVPSRARFARGFLWDEGFSLLLVC